MPYIATGRTDRALLTTAHYTFYYEWGSIVANNSDNYVPAKWITPQKESPGVIWYWINENDCNAEYKPGKVLTSFDNLKIHTHRCILENCFCGSLDLIQK